MKTPHVVRNFVQAAVLSLAALNASASIVTMNVTADLTKANISANTITAGKIFNAESALPLTTPVTVGTGDTFVLNVDFLGNQQLTVKNLVEAWPLVIIQDGNASTWIDMTGTLQLFGSNNAVVASATKTSTDGVAHIAQVFSGSDFGNPASVTFAGLRYTGIVNYESVDPRSYNGPSLRFTGSDVSVGAFQSNPVPEPSTIALFGLAFAGLAAARGRKR